MSSDYVPPEFMRDGFNCPHCGAYSHQIWKSLFRGYEPHYNLSGSEVNRDYIILLEISFCSRCHKFGLWVDTKLVYPQNSPIELPNPDMPDDIKNDYLEARAIFNLSKRGSLALLRFALQKLLMELGGDGKSINADIAYLVKEKGLDPGIQKAMDSLRVFGDQGVHPLELDMSNDDEITPILFTFLNLIVDAMITQPKVIDEIYGKIPENKKNGIENRDNHSA